MKAIGILAGIVVILVVVVWVGLMVQPSALPPYAQQQPALKTVALPKGLPAPVERFYRLTYGDNVPLITTAVITGRGTVRMAGVMVPIRFSFTHEAGRNYRHHIEVTFFGLPVMTVNEYYINGKERMELGPAVDENNPKLDQAGNLGMWAESIMWLPAILVTDPQVKWEAVDDASAFLVVPYGKEQERFLVRFDPASGKMLHWEAMRYKGGVGEKILWIDGMWLDEGTPWANFATEQIALNVPVDVSVAAKGP